MLSAQRWQIVVDELADLIDGRYGIPRARSTRSSSARSSSSARRRAERSEPPGARRGSRGTPRGSRRARRSCCSLALFGDEAEPLLRTDPEPRRGAEDSLEGAGLERRQSRADPRADRDRPGVRDRRGDDRGGRDAGHGAQSASDGSAPIVGRSVSPRLREPRRARCRPRRRDDVVRVESPMVGTFYRAPEPGAAPFVEVGDPVAPGQTLCILEAMKLMNEVKAEDRGVVRRSASRTPQPVEYGAAPVRAGAAERPPARRPLVAFADEDRPGGRRGPPSRLRAYLGKDRTRRGVARTLPS